MRVDVHGAVGPLVRALCVACGLAAVAFAVWSPGLAGPYQFDDFATPLDDPASHSLAAWAGHLGATLRPATKLTYALEAEAGLTAPAPRRAVSILLHAAAAALLGLLAARLAPNASPLGAALAAAVWLVHPVHAESVLAVSGRSALLAALFLLAALLALESRRSLLAGALFVLACLSRETALAGALPLVVLAVSRRDEPARARLAACAPALLGGAAALVGFLATPRYLHLAEYSYLGRPFWSSLFAQVGAVPVGLGLLARPSGLSIDYGVALPDGAGDPLFLLGLLAFAAASAGVVVLVPRSRAAAVGLALWLAALLPTQSVVPKLDALANRPLSLALAGLLLALAPAVASLAEVARRAPRPRLLRAAVAGGAVALLASIAVVGAERSRLYRSELALWGDAAAKSRVNARPHLQFAILLRQQGRHREASAALAAARAIDPFSSRIAALSQLARSAEEVP